MNSPKAFSRVSGTTQMSDHATFNKKADLIMAGNVYSNVQSSTFIRARQELECNGFTKKPGHLQDYDLNNFAGNQREMAPVVRYIKNDPFFEHNTAIAYRFFHYEDGSRRLHGVIVTDENYRVLRRFERSDLGRCRSWKSESVLDFCVQFIALPAASTGVTA